MKKSDWLWIGGSWLITQILILAFLGINNREEAHKYVAQASDWINGAHQLHVHNIFYSGYIAIHVLLRWAGLPGNSMYGVQLALSALSTYYFTKIVCLYSQSRFTRLASGILFATCYIIQQWVSILFTDSIFCSLLIIATYFLVSAEKSNVNKWVFWILLFILPFFRPVGWLFIPIACFYWSMLSISKNAGKLLVCGIYLVILGVWIYKAFLIENYYQPNYPLFNTDNLPGNVICGYPDDFRKYVKLPYREGMSVFSYLYHNPEMTVRLFLARLYKVFSLSRTYFSPRHNLLLSVTSFFYYLLALTGLVAIFRRKDKILYFPFVGILVFSFPLVIFCIEWTGRLSLPVICYVLILSSMGIEQISRYSSFSAPARGDGA